MYPEPRSNTRRRLLTDDILKAAGAKFEQLTASKTLRMRKMRPKSICGAWLVFVPLHTRDMAAQVQLMPRLQEVGTALHPSSADETRAQVPGNDVFAADGGQNAAAAATNHLVEGSGFWSGINGREQSPFRSPSPEYVDAVEDPQYELQHKAMGETVTRGDTNEASG